MILLCSLAKRVFFNNIAIVIGPTPPGTGVMKDAFLDTFLKSTSPTIRYPFSVVSYATLVFPTSITTTSSFTISAFKKLGTPNADMMISACEVIWLMFFE